MENLLFLVTLLPVLGSMIQLLIWKQKDELKANLANLFVIVEMILCGVLFVHMSQNGTLTYTIQYIAGLGLSFKFDGFRALYVLIAAFMWMMTTLFNKEYFHHYKNKTRYIIFNLLTSAGTIGVFLSADLFTTFIYFEIMSVASYVMVAHDETPDALKAAQTYLVVAVFGGMVMLMGLFILYTQTQTLVIDELYPIIEHLENNTMIIISGLCMLVGFGAKAG